MKKSKNKLIIALLATTTAFCGAFGFTACGDGNKDKTEEINLTADTDFTALVSEKVDEDGWKKALTLKAYDINFSNNLTVKGAERNESYTVKYNINELFYKATLDSVTFEASIKKDKDETISYYYYDLDESEGFIQKTPKKDDNTEEYKEMDDLYSFYKVMYCPDFSTKFSSFTYDESKHSYVCSNKVEGTDMFETFNEDCLPDEADYTNVEIKIVNGRLAYLTCDDTENNKIVSYFYDFGKTTITYKDVEEITEMPE